MNRNPPLRFVLIAALSAAGLAALSSAHTATARNELVSAPSRYLDEFSVHPRADLSRYRRFVMDPVRVEFHDDWLRSLNTQRSVAQRVYPDDVQRVKGDMASSLAAIMAEAFEAKGYEIGATPGAGVMRISVHVEDLSVNAPNAQYLAQTKILARDVGQATLIVELSDAGTGVLLARAVRRGTASAMGNFTRADDVSTRFWFDAMFRHWARSCVEEFEAFKGRARPASSSSR